MVSNATLPNLHISTYACLLLLQVFHSPVHAGCPAPACTPKAGVLADSSSVLLGECSHALCVCTQAVHMGGWLCGSLHVVKGHCTL
jgi:hypothetical protein